MLEAPLHRERGVQRPLCMILERIRRAESSHHRVACELLDRPTGRRDLGGHRLVEPLEARARPLRILLAGKGRGARQVGKEDGGKLPFGRVCLLLHRRSAGRAEARVLRRLTGAVA